MAATATSESRGGRPNAAAWIPMPAAAMQSGIPSAGTSQRKRLASRTAGLCLSHGEITRLTRCLNPRVTRSERWSLVAWRAGGAVREGSSYDRGTESHEGLRRQTRRRRVDLPRRAGRRDRLPRSEWLREVDDDAVDSRAGPADGRHCDREREVLPRPCGSTARGRCSARGAVGAHGTLGLQPSARACPDAWDSEAPDCRADRPRRLAGRREEEGRNLLVGNEPTARDRDGAARGSP